jgi:hypothetical protein
MNKRSIAKAFNGAPKGAWTTIASEPIKLTNAFFKSEDESRAEIDVHIQKYLETFLTKAVLKKVSGLKIIVTWPGGDEPFRPYVDRMEVFRLGTKYVLLVHVLNLAE